MPSLLSRTWPTMSRSASVMPARALSNCAVSSLPSTRRAADRSPTEIAWATRMLSFRGWVRRAIIVRTKYTASVSARAAAAKTAMIWLLASLWACAIVERVFSSYCSSSRCTPSLTLLIAARSGTRSCSVAPAPSLPDSSARSESSLAASAASERCAISCTLSADLCKASRALADSLPLSTASVTPSTNCLYVLLATLTCRCSGKVTASRPDRRLSIHAWTVSRIASGNITNANWAVILWPHPSRIFIAVSSLPSARFRFPC